MSRDMKPRAQAEPPKKGGLLTGLLIGLVIGTLAAGGFAWYISRMAIPLQDKPGDEAKPMPLPSQAQASGPIPLPGKPGDKVEEKPRFEFYKILPAEGQAGTEQSPAKPGEQPQAAPAQPAQAAAAPQVPKVEPVFLQVGAFQNPAEADNMKARLALMGLEAGVQAGQTADKGTIYRVRLGPYAKPEDATSARSQLAAAGIPASVAKGN